jgi:hypothetical protein
MMSVQARQEYTREIGARYRAADSKEKSRILDEFVMTCTYNRKYALGLLNNPPPIRKEPIKRPRAARYNEDVRRALAELWEDSGGLCSKRLIPFLPELIAALERHDEMVLSAPVRKKLLCISPATADRLLGQVRRAHPLRGISTTKPGTLLREQIKVRTSFGWDETNPGCTEIDLVAHCAQSAAGEFLHTLTLTDIATGWTECQSLRNKSYLCVTEAIERIRKLLPFPLKGIDSDNGSEFINHHLKDYCQERKIEFTRSRPYHKNDQCYVEQKNWTVVRQQIGYARYEGEQECRYLQSAYRFLRLYVNYFQPSLKLKHKERFGEHDQKVRKQYHEAKTPYQRLLDSKILSNEDAAELTELYEGLNPRELRRRLHESILKLQQAAKVRFSHEATIGE